MEGEVPVSVVPSPLPQAPSPPFDGEIEPLARLSGPLADREGKGQGSQVPGLFPPKPAYRRRGQKPAAFTLPVKPPVGRAMKLPFGLIILGVNCARACC
jgi:hypothetical protein